MFQFGYNATGSGYKYVILCWPPDSSWAGGNASGDGWGEGKPQRDPLMDVRKSGVLGKISKRKQSKHLHRLVSTTHTCPNAPEVGISAAVLYATHMHKKEELVIGPVRSQA